VIPIYWSRSYAISDLFVGASIPVVPDRGGEREQALGYSTDDSEYAAMLTLKGASIDVLGQTMPITIIRGWEVSIRPCEFDNFARRFSLSTNVRTGTSEFRYLIQGLTRVHQMIYLHG
jgi:hypothetical protein